MANERRAAGRLGAAPHTVRVLHGKESMSVSPSGGRHCCKQFSSPFALKSIKQNLMTHFSKPFYFSVMITGCENVVVGKSNYMYVVFF